MILDGYIRVSQVAGRRGDAFISPSVQREQIEAWTSSNRALLGDVFEELDESGGRADRPLLMKAIERVENGESDGMVVAKLDRFGRSLLDGLSAIARIEDAGGTFVSVQDGFDLSTSTGKLVLRIMFSIGEWELERVRINWDIARGRAVARGIYIFQSAPPGYRRGKDRRLRIEPKEAPVIREMYGRRLRGESFRTIARFLNDSELKTHTGVPFSCSHVELLVKTRAYRGEVHSGPHNNPKGHEPIVDQDTWEACQPAARKPHREVQALASGRVRCAGCGVLMGATWNQSGVYRYNCRDLSGRCREPAHVRNDQLDPLIEEFVFKICRQAGSSGSEVSVAGGEEALEKARETLAAYRDNSSLHRRLGADAFEAGVISRQRTVEQALLVVNRSTKTIRRPQFNATDLEARWSKLSWDERRAAVGEFVDCVVVARGKKPVAERTWVWEPGQGPYADRGGARKAERFEQEPRGASKLVAIRSWSKERIERELRAFLGNRSAWPSYGDFADDGRALLHAQVMDWGGPYFWAHKLGLAVRERTFFWTDPLLRNALAPFVEGRTEWPQIKELKAAGMTAVYEAIQHRGGMARWAREFGLEFRTTEKRFWTDERIERELIEFIGEGKHVPKKREFLETNRRSLYSAVVHHGGIGYWAERLEPKWSADVIEQNDPSRKS